MSQDDLISLYPVWRQAAKDACDQFTYGDVIPLPWIRDHLEIDEPAGLLTAEQHRELSFDWLRKVEAFKAVMLEEHKRLLVSVRSVGYKVIAPPHQTSTAMRRLEHEISKSVLQAMKELVHINESMLTLDDARENAEAKAKTSWLGQQIERTLRGPNHDLKTSPQLNTTADNQADQ